jgi:LysR family transcriptional activator of nhaA
MEWLNFQHLLYFGVIAQEGSISRAGKRLRLSHSTLSVQLRTLEEFLGAPLFERVGRGLKLTPFGTQVAEHAAEAARVSAELVDVARGRSGAGRGPRLRIGLPASLPRTTAYRLIEPAIAANPALALVVRQADFETLLGELGDHRLHVVLADRAPPQGLSARLRAHALGETDLVLYGSPALAESHRRRFPASLDGAPMLLPGPGTGLRAAIERWLGERSLKVRVVAEIDDAGLLRACGLGGLGLFPVRAALAAEVQDSRGAVRVGPLTGIRERYYAISVERRVRHPAVTAIVEGARSQLIRPGGSAR